MNDFKFEIDEGRVFITGYTGAGGDVVVPAEIDGLPVTTIEDRAFGYRSGLTSITLGNSVTTIGDAAFAGCTSLTSITLPDSVTTIGGSAFAGCTGLTSITLPDSFTTIGRKAFYGCTSLTRRTPGLKEGSNDKEVKKGDDDSKGELCPFCGVLNKSEKNDVCKHCIGWVDKGGLTRSDQMESLESVWTSLAGKIEQIRAYTQKGLAEKSGASLKTIRLFLKNVEEDHAVTFESSISSGGVDSDTVFPPIFGLCGGEMDCQTKKGIPCLKSNFIYCKDPDSLEEHISDLELLNEFLDEEGNEEENEEGNEEDGRDSENCPFCDALNFWGEMEVCEHHIGMEFDGVIESENLERLKNVWMSLAEKIEKIKEFTQKKLAEKSGASLKTIRLLLKNVDEDHAYDLYSEEFFPPIFDLCWGGENVQSQGMLSGSSQSIYCQDPGALENHISGLERLDKVIEKPDPPIEDHEPTGLNSYEKAIVDYTKAIELDPKSTHAYSERGRAYGNFKQYEKAIADYTQVIQLEPTDAYAFFNRGLAYIRLDLYGKALADLTQAIELDPKLSLPYASRGFTFGALGEYEKAFADYSLAMDLEPKIGWAYTNRGNTYHDLGQYENAIADYNKAIQLAPTDALAYTSRGESFMALGQLALAKADKKRAKELEKG